MRTTELNPQCAEPDRTDRFMQMDEATPPVATSVDQEMDIVDALLIFAKHKRRAGQVIITSVVLGIVIALCIPSTYTARTVLLPPQQQQNSLLSAFLGQLGPISALAGKDALKNPTDVVLGILKSRTVADAVIDKFNLSAVYREKLKTDAREQLEKRVKIAGGKDGIVTVTVEDRDPKRAADIANEYVVQLYAMTQSLAITEASQRRQFFESELVLAKDELARAEGDLRRTQEATGLIQLDDQAKVVIEAVGRLRAEIAAKEVALRAMQSYATQNNPDVLRTNQELAGLRAQLAKLEHAPTAKGNVIVPTGKVPEVGLEYVRKLRELKYREAVYELLLKQYESARLDEAKNPMLIQVIDKAVPPERTSSPRRMIIVCISMLVGFFAAVTWALVSEWSLRNPEQQQRLRYLASQLRQGWSS